MKRNKRMLAAGILPFMAAVPFTAMAKSAPGALALEVDGYSVRSSKNAIAGFPKMTPVLVAGNTVKNTKPTKCPPSPSKPTKKCK